MIADPAHGLRIGPHTGSESGIPVEYEDGDRRWNRREYKTSPGEPPGKDQSNGASTTMLKTTLMNMLLTLAIAAGFLAAPAAMGQKPGEEQQWEFETEGKVVVVGNAFSDYDDFVRILASHDLLDHNNNWIAEDAHLVQTGNIYPKPNDWKKLNNLEFEHERIARLLMKLDKQARKQGGRVHSLHGMLDVSFLRWRIDTIPQNVQTLWATDDSEARQQALAKRWDEDLKVKNGHYGESTQKRLKRDHDNYMNAFYKPGCVEFLERTGKYDPDTHSYILDDEFAQWMRGRNVVIKINNVLYAFNGISPVLAGIEPRKRGGEAEMLSIGEINDLVRSRNNDPTLFLPSDADMDGPVWWSGLARMNSGDIRAYMKEIKARYGVHGMVIGMTQKEHATQSGDVIYAASGLGARNFRTKLNSVVIEGDHWTIIEERRKIEEGDFSPLIRQGGPEDPVKPGDGN